MLFGVAVLMQAWQVLEEPERIRVLLARPYGPIDTERSRGEMAHTLGQRGVTLPVAVEQVDAVTKTAMGKAPLVRAWRG